VRRLSHLPPGIGLAASFAGVGLTMLIGGCELVAGIENLQLTDSDAGAGAAPSEGSVGSSLAGSFDATTGGEAPVDAAGPGDGSAVLDVTVPVDAPDANASDAPQDSTVDAGAIDSSESEESTSDDSGDAALSTELIDNLESDDGHIIPTNGRSGSWFTYNDGTDGGVQLPPPPFLPSPTMPPLGSSMWSAETSGSGFTSFAGMGFTLNDPPTGPEAGVESTYDASGYLGIVFDAHVGSGSATRLRVGFPDANTNASGNYFGEFMTLTTGWTQEVIYFADTTQQNSFGTGTLFPSLDTSAIYGVIFQIDATTPPLTFDLWVDNVAFITP